MLLILVGKLPNRLSSVYRIKNSVTVQFLLLLNANPRAQAMDSIRKRLLIALISLLAIATGAAHAQSGDRDGDGRADILWRNMATGQNWMYMMDGATIMSSVVINTLQARIGEVAGNGDYDGDGRADILWRNSATGQNWMYLMDGAAIESSVGINTVAAT